MSDATIIFFLSLCIVLLICVILYQQFVFRTGIQAKLQKISGKLKEICDICVCVPETETFKVQELHLPVYHYLCAEVEATILG